MRSNEIHESLIRWISELTGLTVIKSHQSGDRPDLPYISVDLVTIMEVNERPADELIEATGNTTSFGFDELTMTPQIEVELTFIVMAMGQGCEDNLRRIKAAAHVWQMHEPLMKELVIHEFGTINSIPQLIDERWEKRAQTNVRVRCVADDSFIIDTIEVYTPVKINKIN